MTNSRSDQFAGLRVRLLAGLIDMVFLSPILIALIYYFGSNEYKMVKLDEDFYYYSQIAASKMQNSLIDYVAYVLAIIYSVYFLSSKSQATPGKRIMKIYVGDVEGRRLSYLKSFWRCLVSVFSILTLGLGFLLIAFTKEKTALHDLICKTRVFVTKK